MVLNKNNFDSKLFNVNNNKLFKDKKFYCLSVVKDSKDKSIKEDITKLIEIHGGTVQYCAQRYSTDYIILCNSSLIYDKNESYYAYQPNLFSNYEKFKSYKLNMLSYTWLFDSIRKNSLIDNYNGYELVDMKEEDNALKLCISKDKDIDDMGFGLFDDIDFGYDYGSNYNNNSNNNNSKQKNSQKPASKEEEEEEEEMFDLFGGDNFNQDVNNSSSSGSGSSSYNNNNDNKMKQQQQQQQKEEEDYDEFNIFNCYNDSNNNKSISNNSNKEKINNLYNSHSSGYIFQFSNSNIKILDNIPKELENQEIKYYEQNSKGYTCITTRSQHLYYYDKSMNQKLYSTQCKQVSFGQDHTLILRDSGSGSSSSSGVNELFSFGTNNNFKQLGIQQDNSNQNNNSNHNNKFKNQLNLNINKIINNRIQIQMISCGKNFSILLDKENNLYSFGQNDYGQLGIGNNDRVEGICKVYKPKEIKEISYLSCGDNHTVLIAQHENQDCDYYYGWGSNLQGQIESKFSNQPNQFKYYNNNSYSSKLLCYHDSTIIISQNNKVQIFGVQNDTLADNLKLYFTTNQQYQLVKLKNKAGVLVYDTYSQIRFYVQSLNYNDSLHFKVLSSIIKKSLQVQDAIKLVKDCFLNSNVKVFQLLEARFSNKLIDPSNQQTPFHIAAKYCTSNDALEILDILIKLNHYSIDDRDSELNTPLHLSTLHLNFQVTEYLLLKGCNRNLKNKLGETPLHISVKSSKNVAMSSLLCKHGAQSIPDKVMKTPLQYCTSGDEKQNLQNIIFTNQVFISYAHKDSVFVNSLRSLFGLSSLRCWLDEYRLQAGCNWRSEITKGVENSQIVVFVVSETSVQSLWCRKELKMSKRLGKIILPLFLQPNVYIDPTLYGLFTIIPKQTKSNYQEMEENEVLSNVKALSGVIHSLLRNGSGGEFNNSTINSLIEKYSIEKSIYFTFNQIDRVLSDFIKETIVEKNHLPLISNDEINGKLDQHQDPYSSINLSKEKQRNSKIRKLKFDHEKQIQELKDEHSKQLWKLSRKVDKKLSKLNYYPSTIDYQLTKSQLEKEFNINEIKSNQHLEFIKLKKNQLNQLKLKFNLNINDQLNQLNQLSNHQDSNNNNNNNYNSYSYSYDYNSSYSSFNNNNDSNNSSSGYNYNYNFGDINNNNKEEEEYNIPILNNYISTDENDSSNNNNNNNNNNNSYNYGYSFGDYNNNNNNNQYDSYNSYNNDSYNSFNNDNYNSFNNDNYNSNNDSNDNSNQIKYNINSNNLNYLEKCLLHLVLFTKKTTSIEIDNYIEEIKYTSSLKKTIVVITPDISLKSNDSTPSILRDLVWYEIDIKNINQVFDNIILIYDILEKTNQITNQIKNFSN